MEVGKDHCSGLPVSPMPTDDNPATRTQWLLLAHVLPRRGIVGLLRRREINTDDPAVQVVAVQMLDGGFGMLDLAHRDESEPSRTVSLE